ncbi:hypothetical protein NESM_000879600 [Novymonas esmeraldas]|uniref:PDZ domain-containing protein n=1 Tax=Novymonas esmeraldas TaxID=1808958 RepID=A0AAW0EXL6_9TRYP
MPSSTAPFTMAIEFAPDESRASIRGSVTITKATLTVFRVSGAAARAMRDPATNERSTFVGVCSLPLIQLYRHRNVLTLLRGTSFLFDNAAVSIGLSSEGGARATDSPASSAIGDAGRTRRDNPSLWESLAIRCATLDDCDRIVEVLLTRGAEETFVPPFPMQREKDRASRNTSTPTSVNSYSRHNEQGERTGDSHRHRHTHSSRRSSPSVDSRGQAPSNVSERPARNDSTQRDSTQRDLGSQRTGESTPRSSRLPSRREHDDLASTSTPVHSMRSSQQRVAPGRATTAANTAAQVPHDAPKAPPHRHRSAERAHEVPAAPRSRPHSSTHRRHPEPAEREFTAAAAAAEEPRQHSRSHRHHSATRPSTSSRSPRRGARAAEEDRSHSRHHHRHHSPRSDTASPTSASASRRHVSPRAETMDYSASVSPRSTMSRTHKSGQDAFLRSVQRLQHHRLHFMQYLHKEMAHQAYLVEEAKVKAAAAAARTGTPGRRRTGSPAAAAEEEAARLRQIESRLAQVEALHREAEREREEAARLRREYEWRHEELNARLGSGGGVGGSGAAFPGGVANGSRDVSEPNSSVMSPHRSSAYPAMAGQLMVVPQHNGGSGSAYPLTAHHQGFASSAEWALSADPAAAPRPDDVDLGVAIIDRYVFGEEWHRVYPAYEADVRFNAQIDVCLAMKLPRRLVTITNVAVDRPGLRVTAEVRYDRAKIERDGVERRMQGCPFRFLQRFYDMRDLYDPMRDGAAALTGGGGSGSTPIAITPNASAGGRRPSARTSRRASRALSGQRRRSGAGRPYNNSDVSELSGSLDDGDDFDADTRRDRYYRRADDRVRAAEDRMARRRQRVAAELRHQVADNILRLEEEEEYLRDGIQLAEAKGRQKVGREARSHVKTTLSSSLAYLEEEERVARAATEVGAARQLHVLMDGHRRALARFGHLASEAERRRQIVAQEAQARRDLNDAMNPARAGQRRLAERQAREAEVLASRGSAAPHASQAERRAAIEDLEADEVAARAILRSQAMGALLDLLFRSPAPTSKDGRRAPSHAPSTLSALLRDLMADEAAQRQQIVAEERRRRALYRQEDVVKREAAERVSIEAAELDARDAILDSMMALNRHQLERRLSDREQLQSLLHEEQFYRKTILSDEQDAFEVIAELFAAGLKDLLTHVPATADEDDEDLRRRRISTTRQAKPFHYMTFSPDDMDYPPSAVLAIEGIVGCSINKNLEVVSVARPLPKAEEEDLQLQAGDMILDVAGHSLHSVSHLREVLSNRAMQIQEEALAEFPNIPTSQLTINPALQKYIEVLCEHHNFLVQVLRGCEIYQIIVRS